MQWREIHNNFFIDNYSQQEAVDNDDGSCYYHTHDNFLVYGKAMKTDFGGHDIHHYNNLYGFASGYSETMTDSRGNQFYGNTIVSYPARGDRCDLGPGGGLHPLCSDGGMHDNTYYTQTGTACECNRVFNGTGLHGTTSHPWPSTDTVMGWAKAKIGM